MFIGSVSQRVYTDTAHSESNPIYTFLVHTLFIEG